MRTRLLGCGWLLVVGFLGCAPVAPPANGGLAAAPAAVGPPKVIVAGALAPLKAFGAWTISGGGGTFALHGIHSSSLFTLDAQGNPAPLLLSKLPALDDGSMVILPDGRMQTTWTLRPGIKWHDGSPLTSADLAFTLQVYRDPEVGLAPSEPVNNIERIDAPEPTVAIVTWKAPYYQPYHVSLREFWPLPEHILASSLAGDKQGFANLPYWTTEYVNSGPFRLVDYGLGQDLVFERFADYFLGTPKVARIVIRVLGDPATLYANLKAKALDLGSYNTLPADAAVALAAEWKQSGEGTVAFAPGSMTFFSAQFDPQWASPLEIADVRVRQGLFTGVDREALREAMLPGVADTAASSYLPSSDPRTPDVGSPLSRYVYDPTRAAQLLAAAGWRRAEDGRMLGLDGRQVDLNLHIQQGDKAGAIFAQYWRNLGIAVDEVQVPPELATNGEYNATFPSFDGSSSNSREGFFMRLLSSRRPTPQNRFAGDNRGHFSNPQLDEAFGALTRTPSAEQQLPVLRQLGEILATELPVLPGYFTVSTAAVRGGVHALDDFQGDSFGASMSRNAYQWDRD
ncbi:MAG: peptide/nickel transport system substrate-binding protein [Chloroflexota bacterium]|jgi:peptide/nickel transport system substrate-binding protein|nr:peptide/nickel transport system substrate-binding protein [Chloroflexota bacterium]